MVQDQYASEIVSAQDVDSSKSREVLDHAQIVRGVALRYANTPSRTGSVPVDADDLEQAGWLALLELQERHPEPTYAQVTGTVRTAIRAQLGYGRSNLPQRPRLLGVESPHPLYVDDEEDFRKRLKRLMPLLTPRELDCLKAKVSTPEAEHAAIAERLGLSVVRVKQLWASIKDKAASVEG